MAKRKQSPRPLRCAQCGATGDLLTVAGAGNRRQVRGKQRLATHVRCAECGNEWYSVAREAITRGREADEFARTPHTVDDVQPVAEDGPPPVGDTPPFTPPTVPGDG